MIAKAGLIAYVPSLLACVAAKLWLLVAVDTFFYAGILFAAYRQSAGYLPKLYSLVGAGLGLGAFVLFYAGAEGAGYIWLIFGIIISALLGRKGAVFATLMASIAIMGFYSAASALGWVARGQNALALLVIATNLILICIALTYIIRRLIAGLAAALHEREDFATKLELELAESKKAREALGHSLEKSESLLRELHHRVKNNMQLALSLVAIENEAGPPESSASLAGLERRLRALSAVNDLMLAESTSGDVELCDLVRLLAVPERKRGGNSPEEDGSWIVESFSIKLGSGEAVVAAITITEIVATLGGTGGGAIRLERSSDGPRLLFRISPPEQKVSMATEALKMILANPVLLKILAPDTLSTASQMSGHCPGLYFVVGEPRVAAT